MGRCHEFGLQIREGCGHPMRPGDNACACEECGVVCGGRFAGCPDVWLRGPQPVTVLEGESGGLAAGIRVNGGARRRATTPPKPPEIVATAPERPKEEAPARQPAASAAALRWLEGAFAGLREELQSLRGTLNQQQATLAELVNGLTQQQAILTELLEARSADFRLAAVAEALPGRVEQAVARGVTSGQREAVEEIVRTVELTQGQAVSALSRAFEGSLERAASKGPEETAAELRAFLETDGPTSSIVAAIATQAAADSLRTEIHKQLPAAVQRAADRSDRHMEELVERTEKAVARLVRAGAKARAAAEAPAAEVTKATATKAKAAKSTTARTSANGSAKAGANASAKATAAKATKTAKTGTTKAARTTAGSGRAKAARTTKAGTARSRASAPGSKAPAAATARSGAARPTVARRPARTAPAPRRARP